MSSSRKFQIGAFIILLFHTVGLIGMNVGVYTSIFESVAWANILLSLGLLMWCDENILPQKHEDAKDDLPKSESPKEFSSQRREDAKALNPINRLIYFIAITCIMGFCIEVIGVRTGLLFGIYHYTPAFGWSLMSVPLIIGLNWMLLTYAIGAAISRFQFSTMAKVLTGAFLMTACDMLLEGFAIKHHFWVWESATPPIQNFIGWFLVSLIMQSIYNILIPHSRNRLAAFYLIVFIVFLMIDMVL